MKEDIFDRLLALPIFSGFAPYREQILYVFFGGMTTLLNIGTFWLAHTVFGMHELRANAVAWIVTMFAVYISNRIWVFRSPVTGFVKILGEIFRFLAGRVFTLLMDELLLFIFITELGFPSMPVKVIAQAAVIIVNYFISRIIVFRKQLEREQQ